MLIRFVEVDEYSHFILIFTFFTILFQVVSSVIERLYIVEFETYKHNEVRYNWILIISLLFLPALYVLLSQNDEDFFLVMFLSITSILFQIKRIRLQRNERYGDYVKLEIVRNFIWVFVVLIILCFYRKGFYIYILYSLGFINLVMLWTPMKRARNSNELCSDSFKYVFSRYYLILFSVLAGLFPYIVFMLISNSKDQVLLASIGAAMRYQALLSMVVLSINTVFLPKLNNEKFSHEPMMLMFWKRVKAAFLISLIFIVAVYFLIPIVDNGKYPDSQLFFVLISITSLVSLISLPIVNKLLANYKYKELFYSLVTGLGVACIFYFAMAALSYDGVVALFLSMIVAYVVNLILNFTKYIQVNKSESFNN